LRHGEKMSYPINYPTPQGANIQIFGGNGSGFSQAGGGGNIFQITTREWVKPAGCSFVWFTLIGAGGGGSSAGGGSGAVTNFMCPAFLIPDVLRVNVGNGGGYGNAGSDTTIVYQNKDSTGYTLLTAAAGTFGQTGGAASTSNFFTAMGFFQSTAGQDGNTGTASTTTFLSGGTFSGSVVPNYGYPTGTSSVTPNGFFQMQPIIVGRGGVMTGKGGIGCGGGTTGSADGYQNGGGDGLAVIISW